MRETGSVPATEAEIRRHLARNLVLGEIFARTARKYPGKPAVVSEEGTLTYRELDERVNRLAAAWLDLGVSRGDKVAVLMPNSIRTIESYYAAHKCGAVVVPVNIRLSPKEVKYILDHADARVLVYDEALEETVRVLRQERTGIEHWVVAGKAGRPDTLEYEKLLLAGRDEEPLVPVDDDDVCYIAYTAGTTGLPKGAMITHKNAAMTAMISVASFRIGAEDRYFVAPPIFHVAGYGAVNICFQVGATVLLKRSFDAREILRFMAAEQATLAVLVPVMWNLIVKDPELSRFDLRSLRLGLSGGAVLQTEIKRKVREVFPNCAGIVDIFGQTEAAPTCALLPEEAERKPGSVGRPLPHIEIRVVGEDGREVQPGEVGEIQYRGPTTFLGYYKDPDRTLEAFVDGWFRSGDLVRTDEEGFVHVVDRRNDTIVSGGENVYPAEVERVLFGHPKIVEAAVVGIPHEKWGEAVHAFIVCKPGETLTQDELVAFCRAHLAGYKIPRSFDLLPELPRNAAGKVLRRELRRKYGSAIRY